MTNSEMLQNFVLGVFIGYGVGMLLRFIMVGI